MLRRQPYSHRLPGALHSLQTRLKNRGGSRFPKLFLGRATRRAAVWTREQGLPPATHFVNHTARRPDTGKGGKQGERYDHIEGSKYPPRTSLLHRPRCDVTRSYERNHRVAFSTHVASRGCIPISSTKQTRWIANVWRMGWKRSVC